MAAEDCAVLSQSIESNRIFERARQSEEQQAESRHANHNANTGGAEFSASSHSPCLLASTPVISSSSVLISKAACACQRRSCNGCHNHIDAPVILPVTPNKNFSDVDTYRRRYDPSCIVCFFHSIPIGAGTPSVGTLYRDGGPGRVGSGRVGRWPGVGAQGGSGSRLESGHGDVLT